MSNYYYDRSKNCYRTKRNHHQKCNCECNRHPRYHTFTSGPLFRNADTDFIQVSALNQTDEPQTVTIAVQNYQDTCDGDIYPSYGYLCGERINDDNNGNGSDATTRNGDDGCIYCEPEGVAPFVAPFVGPVTFTIPPRQLFSVRVFRPEDPHIPQDPTYVVRVTLPGDPLAPKLIERNPMKQIKNVNEPQEEIAVLTVDELRRLLDAQNKQGYSDFQDYVIMNLL